MMAFIHFAGERRGVSPTWRTDDSSEHTSGLRLDARQRSAFTLIELLVVIALIMVLAAIAIMFVPRIEEGQRAARGASLLQGWLNIARQRAMRDQQARGLRLYVSGGIVTDCQYLDLPDDFTGGTLSQGASLNQVSLQADANGTGDLSNGQSNSALWSVQSGDYLLILSTGLVHQITGITGTNPTFSITLASDLSPNGLGQATRNYRILRAPRVSGEEKLSLPQYIGINVTTNQLPPTGYAANANNVITPNSDGVIDILFGPSGNVIGDWAGTDMIILWVCDTSLANTPWDGEPTLITVYTRTGLVAPVPVDPSGGTTPGTATPYTFTSNP
jgi:prepilin-type N-terminal cleavage/methylation domain-containing protein